MLLPARLLLFALALWLLASIGVALFPAALPMLWGLGALIAAATLIDAGRAWWERAPSAQRQLRHTLALGQPAKVEICLTWNEARHAEVRVLDHSPDQFSASDAVLHARLAPHSLTTLSYRLRPQVRGEHHFGAIMLRLRSPWRLWWMQQRIEAAQAVRVFPNFAPLARHALQASAARSAQSGMLKRRRRGEGLDFDQLREYRAGDSPRRIDWKASRRFDKLISREYQDERDQRILLMVDCGRRMAARENSTTDAAGEGAELSHFDHALNTLLMLAYVGLRHGDAVGVHTLGGPQRWLAPHKSTAALARILHLVYDLQPGLEATDYERAAQTLLSQQRKRALVVLLTNLRDEDDANLLAACRLLGRRHLVLVASLREQALDKACQSPAHDHHSLARRAAALDYRNRREAAFRRLRQEGVLCLDVAPQELAVAAVNQYLAIKAAGRL